MKARRYDGLDGLRGIAALSVMVMHITLWFGADRLLKGAGLAVDFFFCLSGFVIVHAYGERIAKGLSFLDFMAARLVRLYPLILFSFVLGAMYAGAAAILDGRSLGGVAISFLLSVPLIPHENPDIAFGLFPLNGPTWSLFLEIWVNVAFFGLAAWLGVKRSVWLLPLCVLPMLVLSTDTNTLVRGFTIADMPYGAARVCLSFLIGVALYQALRGRLKANGNGWLFAALSAGLLVAIILGNTLRGPPFELAFMLLVSPALIAAGATIGEGRLTPVMRWLGDLSYPLYLLHWPIGQFTVTIGKRLPFFKGASDPVLLVCTGLTIIAGSWLVLKLYDEPVRRLLNAAVRSKRSETPAVAAA